MSHRVVMIAFLASLAACSGASTTDGGVADAGAVDADRRDTGTRDAFVLPGDSGMLIQRDGGRPLTCSTTCNCPQGQSCFDERCQDLGRPVYCCDKAGCPGGETCLDTTDQPDTCAGGPNLGDGGTCRRDAGTLSTDPQEIGGNCEVDANCFGNLTCWTRDESPGFWGYCTLENCDVLGCPAGSACFRFNDSSQTGCLQTCDGNDDCRVDAYCRPVGQLPGANGVCIPNCRDDFLDCPPRNGTSYCSPVTGQCETTPSQFPSPRLGGRCINNIDCGRGEVCLGEAGFGYPCGMCGQACAGVPEATPCAAGSTCQPIGSIGVCFLDCSSEGLCPLREDAACGMLDGWVTPSCVPVP